MLIFLLVLLKYTTCFSKQVFKSRKNAKCAGYIKEYHMLDIYLPESSHSGKSIQLDKDNWKRIDFLVLQSETIFCCLEESISA
jgi:hypothetical protein